MEPLTQFSITSASISIFMLLSPVFSCLLSVCSFSLCLICLVSFSLFCLMSFSSVCSAPLFVLSICLSLCSSPLLFFSVLSKCLSVLFICLYCWVLSVHLSLSFPGSSFMFSTVFSSSVHTFLSVLLLFPSLFFCFNVFFLMSICLPSVHNFSSVIFFCLPVFLFNSFPLSVCPPCCLFFFCLCLSPFHLYIVYCFLSSVYLSFCPSTLSLYLFVSRFSCCLPVCLSVYPRLSFLLTPLLCPFIWYQALGLASLLTHN